MINSDITDYMVKDGKPAISVLITTYNREHFIKEAIESVIESSYKDFELIILDDHSTDKTASIAKSYLKLDKRISLYINERNVGQFHNRNKAASLASGKYIKYLDSDDKIFDWGLEYCIEMMQKYPEAGMGIFDAGNQLTEEMLCPVNSINKHFFQTSYLNVGPSGTILRLDAFEKVGGFYPEYGVPADKYFNIKMASLFPIVILKKKFFFYRQHEGQEIKNKYSYLLNNYPYTRDILQLPELPLANDKKGELLAIAKKSFLKACLRNIISTGKIRPAYKAFKHSKMGFRDIISAILNKQI